MTSAARSPEERIRVRTSHGLDGHHESLEDVTLRDDADQLAVLTDRQASDTTLEHHGSGLRYRCVGPSGDHSPRHGVSDPQLVQYHRGSFDRLPQVNWQELDDRWRHRRAPKIAIRDDPDELSPVVDNRKVPDLLLSHHGQGGR